MRTATPALIPLFRSHLQLKLLGLLFSRGDEWWTADELRNALDAPRASVHRELIRALNAGILERTVVGTTHRYRPAWHSPLSGPLSELLDVTVGVEGQIREALAELPGIDAAVIYGSFAAEAGIRPRSDVDLLILGNVDVREVRRALRPVERKLGREIDARSYAVQEFSALRDAQNGFVLNVVRNPVVPLFGSAEALAFFSP